MREILWRGYLALMRALFVRFRKLGTHSSRLSVLLKEGVHPAHSYYWFHAASAGEWECLSPVVERALLEGCRCIVSAFSPSGWPQLERLQRFVAEQNLDSSFLVSGFSPNEGEWSKLLSGLRVSAFVTVKYEAWPELWRGLETSGIPVYLLGAQARPSLKWLSRFLRFFKIEPFSLFLEVPRSDEVETMRRWFPTAEIIQLGDPRWDRVQARARKTHPRISHFRRKIEASPSSMRTSVGVLGSIWPEDLEVIAPKLGELQQQGARGWIFCVPHRVDSEGIRRCESELERAGIRWVRSTEIQEGKTESLGDTQFVLVNEMGFLLELYGLATWAFVGGGFGAGIHSTLEPAYFSIPIATGPARVDVFSETYRLRICGQMSVVRNSAEFSEWIDFEHQERLRKSSPQWQTEVQLELGATERVWGWIRGQAPVQ